MGTGAARAAVAARASRPGSSCGTPAHRRMGGGRKRQAAQCSSAQRNAIQLSSAPHRTAPQSNVQPRQSRHIAGACRAARPTTDPPTDLPGSFRRAAAGRSPVTQPRRVEKKKKKQTGEQPRPRISIQITFAQNTTQSRPYARQVEGRRDKVRTLRQTDRRARGLSVKIGTRKIDWSAQHSTVAVAVAVAVLVETGVTIVHMTPMTHTPYGRRDQKRGRAQNRVRREERRLFFFLLQYSTSPAPSHEMGPA